MLHAADARISDLKTEVVQGQIVVSAVMSGEFREETWTDLHNGIPKDTYYYIVLMQKRRNWFDEELHAVTVHYAVRFDLLKKIYQVVTTFDGHQSEAIYHRFEEMKTAVSSITRIPLAPDDVLAASRRRYVRVKMQMQTTRLPLYLDHLLFFIPFLELDTEWSRSEDLPHK